MCVAFTSAIAGTASVTTAAIVNKILVERGGDCFIWLGPVDSVRPGIDAATGPFTRDFRFGFLKRQPYTPACPTRTDIFVRRPFPVPGALSAQPETSLGPLKP